MVADGQNSSALVSASPVVPSASPFDPEARVLKLNHEWRPMGMGWRPESISVAEALAEMYRGRMYMVRGTGEYVHSKYEQMPIPTVVAVGHRISYEQLHRPAVFDVRKLYIRDVGTCRYSGVRVYMGHKDPKHRATFDHVTPRSKGGETDWMNALLASEYENVRKGDLLPERYTLPLSNPWEPTQGELLRLWLTDERLKDVPAEWLEFLDRTPPTQRLRTYMEEQSAKAGRDMWRWQREEGAGLCAA